MSTSVIAWLLPGQCCAVQPKGRFSMSIHSCLVLMLLTYTSAHAVVSQVVWSAWLSTLGHAPSIMDLADSQNVHNFTDSASALVDQFVPVSLQVCLLLLSVCLSVCLQVSRFVCCCCCRLGLATPCNADCLLLLSAVTVCFHGNDIFLPLHVCCIVLVLSTAINLCHDCTLLLSGSQLVDYLLLSGIDFLGGVAMPPSIGSALATWCRLCCAVEQHQSRLLCRAVLWRSQLSHAVMLNAVLTTPCCATYLQSRAGHCASKHSFSECPAVSCRITFTPWSRMQSAPQWRIS